MAKLEFFIVSESFSVDQGTNRLSIFNVLEEIPAPGFPVVLPQFAVVSSYNADSGDEATDFQQVVRITIPGQTVREFPQNFRITGRRHRVLLTFTMIQVSGPGRVELDVSLNGKHQASHAIDVIPPVSP